MTTFQALGLVPTLVEALEKKGIRVPTPIQEKSIPPTFKGFDLIAQAQTGTGKTFAFLLPILQRINVESRHEQALIIAPTRELVKQMAEVAKPLGELLSVDVLPLIGGKTIEGQLQQLGRRPHVVIGTPGRLLDHCHRGSLKLQTIRYVVLDEADQMLHMGFLPDVESLLDGTNKDRQLLLFSATMPDRVRKLAKHYMNKPVSVTVAHVNKPLENIKQEVYLLDERDKYKKLVSLLREHNPYLAIVFCNKKEETTPLVYKLVADGFSVGELQGNMTQGHRTQVLREFSKGHLQILVATDIAARGIDIEGISHIYNYGIPSDIDYFVHRVGRTGRAGATGVAVSLVIPEEEGRLRRIERAMEATFTKYTKDGQVKVKAAGSAPKREKNRSGKPSISSNYQPTKKKAHKSVHKGVNRRKRRSSR